MSALLQSYHSISSRELGMQREASSAAEGTIVQWQRPGSAGIDDNEVQLGWVNVGAATVRAMSIEYRTKRLDRFQIIGRDGVTAMWLGFAGPPQVQPLDAGSYSITVNLTPFPR